MDSTKRPHSPAGSERCAKVAKILHESDNVVAAEPPGQHHSAEVQVTVKLRSISKAARNDPNPPDEYWQQLLAPALSSMDAGSRPSTASENGQTTRCPPHPVAPGQSSPSTTLGGSEASTSVDDSHPYGNGPIGGHAEEGTSDHSA